MFWEAYSLYIENHLESDNGPIMPPYQIPNVFYICKFIKSERMHFQK
jgi:DNA topoisomerase VI subunit B